MRSRNTRAFTLVELLVVIGIIALLVGILLPALNKARATANAAKCASNMRTVGQLMAMYASNNKGKLPLSYIYVDANRRFTTNPQVPTGKSGGGAQGYLHWTAWVNQSFQPDSVLTDYTITNSAEAFTCPSMNEGGLRPTNPAPTDVDGGTFATDGNMSAGAFATGSADSQVRRTAFTLNEALCGRGKLAGYATRAYQWVSAGQVKNSGGTILATEYVDEWRMLSSVSFGGSGKPCKSHRPVHAFMAAGASGSAGADLEGISLTTAINRIGVTDINPDSRTAFSKGTWTDANYKTRLDWVGRNHGTGKQALKTTNFLYLDGHVETKHLEETLVPWQWGQRLYSLANQELVQSE